MSGGFSKRTSCYVSLWLLWGAFGAALSIYYRDYMLYSDYDDPPARHFIPFLFEYLAFVLVVFIYAWSIRVIVKPPFLRTLAALVVSMTFVVVYLFFLSFLDWHSGGRVYDFWRGFSFTIKHSFFPAMVIYGIISVFVSFLHESKESTSGKSYLTRIPCKKNGKTKFVDIEKVVFFQADGNYVSLHVDGDGRFLIRRSLTSINR